MRRLKLFKEHAQEGITIGEECDFTVPERDEVIEIIKDTLGIDEFSEDELFESGEQFLNYIQEIYDYFLEPFSKDNMFPIYRAVAAEDVDLSEYGIGESWSVYLDNAKTFGGRLGYPLDKINIITANVKPNNINWKITIQNFVQFTDIMDGDSEWEVHVPAGCKLENITVSSFREAKERII
jgi:hypothetical protein